MLSRQSSRSHASTDFGSLLAEKNGTYHPSLENKFRFFISYLSFFAILFFILWKNFSFGFGCSRGPLTPRTSVI